MQSNLSTHRADISTQLNSTQATNITPVNALISSLMIAIPVVVITAVARYRKYRVMVIQKRIQRLNRLWQLDISKNLS